MRVSGTKRKNKLDIGAELEKKALMKEEKYSKSQQEILKKMKEANEAEHNKKLTDSLKRAFNTVVDDEGNTLIDEVAAKTAATYKTKDTITIQDAIQLKDALGENNKTNIDLNMKGEMSFKEVLREIADEGEF